VHGIHKLGSPRVEDLRHNLAVLLHAAMVRRAAAARSVARRLVYMDIKQHFFPPRARNPRD